MVGHDNSPYLAVPCVCTAVAVTAASCAICSAGVPGAGTFISVTVMVVVGCCPGALELGGPLVKVVC